MDQSQGQEQQMQTQQQAQQQMQQVRLQDVTPEQALDVVWQYLNRSSKAGVFTVDESYVLKVVFDVLVKRVRDTSELSQSQ